MNTPKIDQTASSESPSQPCSPKIYRVEISYEIYVYADHERDAVDYAHDGVRDEEPEAECATQINSVEEVPKEWRDSLPYGSRDLIKYDKSIREILSENAQGEATPACAHDYENAVRKGRVRYHCTKCDADISLGVILIAEACATR